ncbi:MAG: M15 family metallopeptidase, partial [Eubacteriales bacterium]|nr:M15 family metallopeptidase [Eubacteriales bacterium]
YIPENLTDLGLPFDAPPGDPKRLLELKTARAAQSLIHASQREGLSLYGISGYRSYERQKELYRGSPYVAPPGASEHQSGLALDLSCPRVGLQLTEAFAYTPEGLWLAANASLFGFILRYPKNKEELTGVPYEPWHIRYVTRPLAAFLSLTGQTLEEYHALSSSYAGSS